MRLKRTAVCRLGKQLQFQLGNIVSGVFTPVLAKHTKHLSLVDVLAVGVDRMQRKAGIREQAIGNGE